MGLKARKRFGKMSEAARINVVELSVTELSAALKRTVEDSFGYVRVRGEISGYRGPHTSGHVYFSLKDDNALIEAVIWKMTFNRMKIRPEEGLEVVVTGRVTTFPGRSKYQIVIETLEPAGVGALLKQLEERKKKLAAEGLFEEARKQLLPFIPGVVGVVTSPTGAVIRDILHRLADRFPRSVIVWPVRVQGDGAAAEIAAAIRGFSELPEGGRIPRPDVLIVARGGGSLEDLWCFNEEIVVRAAAESLIPLISAVGHETDVTLIDFAADRRAPTPTAAAEIAVPVRGELLSRIAALGARQFACWQRGIEIRKRDLRSLARALPSPDRLFADRRQRLDNLSERLPRALRANAHLHHQQLSRIAGRLSASLLRTRLERCNVLVESFDARGRRAYGIYLARRNDRVRAAGQLLNAFSYRGVLSRGFALVRDEKGAPLRAASSVSPGLRLDIEFSDGRVGATADGGGAPQAAKPKTKTGGRSGQGSLF
jgi:exodeoxyribonuclease VII large subunit